MFWDLSCMANFRHSEVGGEEQFIQIESACKGLILLCAQTSKGDIQHQDNLRNA